MTGYLHEDRRRGNCSREEKMAWLSSARRTSERPLRKRGQLSQSYLLDVDDDDYAEHAFLS